jgi:hypothetical protein
MTLKTPVRFSLTVHRYARNILLPDTILCRGKAGRGFCFAVGDFSNGNAQQPKITREASTGGFLGLRIVKVDRTLVQVFHDGEDFPEWAGGDQESAAGAVGFGQLRAIWTGLPYRAIEGVRHAE